MNIGRAPHTLTEVPSGLLPLVACFLMCENQFRLSGSITLYSSHLHAARLESPRPHSCRRTPSDMRHAAAHANRRLPARRGPATLVLNPPNPPCWENPRVLTTRSRSSTLVSSANLLRSRLRRRRLTRSRAGTSMWCSSFPLKIAVSSQQLNAYRAQSHACVCLCSTSALSNHTAARTLAPRTLPRRCETLILRG